MTIDTVALCLTTLPPIVAVVGDESPVSVVITAQETLVLALPAQQGVAGPPGQGGGETALRTDFTDPRYWYVEYASRIKRLDQSVSPAAVGFSVGAWGARSTLSFSS